MFSIFKEYIPEGESTPVRTLIGAFTDSPTISESVEFTRIYHDVSMNFNGKLIIVDSITAAEADYIPNEAQ